MTQFIWQDQWHSENFYRHWMQLNLIVLYQDYNKRFRLQSNRVCFNRSNHCSGLWLPPTDLLFLHSFRVPPAVQWVLWSLLLASSLFLSDVTQFPHGDYQSSVLSSALIWSRPTFVEASHLSVTRTSTRLKCAAACKRRATPWDSRGSFWWQRYD